MAHGDDVEAEGGARDVRRSAARLLAFLEQNRIDGQLQYPFSSCFPGNSCESVSRMLAALTSERYPGAVLRILQGSHPGKNEHHFWVEIDGLIYDLTAHQFPGHSPILGAPGTPLVVLFPQIEIALDEPLGGLDLELIVQAYRDGMIPF